MDHIFISYAEEDTATAVELARGIEAAGYTTWYYGRDSVAGPSYLQQLALAIEESQTFLLVISRHSLSSHQVTKEVERAHECGKPFLPVLLGVTHAESVERCQASWRMALGSATRCCVRAEEVSASIPAVVEGLKALCRFAQTMRPGLESCGSVNEDGLRELLEEKSRGFVGRMRELNDIRSWMRRESNGFLLIEGPQGVGKSALMAVLSRDPGSGVDVVPTFIRRADNPSPDRFLRLLLARLASRYQLKFVAGSCSEMRDELNEQFRAAGRRLKADGRKLVLIMDGLDEALGGKHEVAGRTLLDFIPRRLPDSVLLLMTGKPGRPEIDRLYEDLEGDKKERWSLHGLPEADIATLFSQAATQHKISSDYEQQLRRVSDGVPLYLKLVLRDILAGRIAVNDFRMLPPGIQEQFESIFARLEGSRPEAADVLMTLACAREQLTTEQLAHINDITVAETRSVAVACAEVLHEATDMQRRRVWGISHDSFAEFLRDHHDYQGLKKEIARRHLRFALHGNGVRSEDQEMESLMAILLTTEDIPPERIPALCELIERTADTLTAQYVVAQSLLARRFNSIVPLLDKLAGAPGPALANAVTECAVAGCRRDPDVACEFMRLLITDRPGKHTGRRVACIQRVRIALDMAASLAEASELREPVIDVLLAACRHPDKNVRTLGIIGVFRVTKASYDTGMQTVRRLAEEALWFGFPRRSRLEALAGCALGLFLEDADNETLRSDLCEISRDVFSRLRFVKPLLWLLPNMAAALLSHVPDDYNPNNLAELKAFKDQVARNPGLSRIALEVIEFADPRTGTAQEFALFLERLVPVMLQYPSFWLMAFVQLATINRASTGDVSALHASYAFWQAVKMSGRTCAQDLPWQLRLVQLGCQLRGRAPLDEQWTDRASEVANHFFFTMRGTCRESHEYMGGALIPAVPFLVRQTGQANLQLLKAFVDHALQQRAGAQNGSKQRRHKQLDGILMRVIEVDAIEIGSYDAGTRHAALFGLRCFLDQPDRLDDFLWDRIATILARVRTYFTEEAVRFLGELPDVTRDALQRRMQKIVPEESLSVLLSVRSEKFLAWLCSEPADSAKPLRPRLLKVLRVVAGQESLSETLRFVSREILDVVTGGSESQGTIRRRSAVALH